MDPGLGKAAFIVGTVALVVVRASHVRRSLSIPVVARRHPWRERILLTGVAVGLLVQVAWVTTPVFAAADYPLRPVPFAAGVALIALGLWLLHRSHVDLGRNWSNTLEIRERHALVVQGVYRRVRHPMYLAFLLYGVGQALAMPNLVAGPAFAVTFGLLVAFRIRAEERMMVETFGDAYSTYAARTKRLVPGFW
jgi:protein-S-isoprenylcysteine O-methyltransferase Ste14